MTSVHETTTTTTHEPGRDVEKVCEGTNVIVIDKAAERSYGMLCNQLALVNWNLEGGGVNRSGYI